jgi:PAS domain S-box-containing protein
VLSSWKDFGYDTYSSWHGESSFTNFQRIIVLWPLSEYPWKRMAIMSWKSSHNASCLKRYDEILGLRYRMQMKKQDKYCRTDKKSDRNLLKHIYDISYLLTQSPDLDEVLNEIIDHVMTGLKYDRAIVMLLNEDETKLECRCIRGFTPLGTKRAWERPLILKCHDCYETKVVRSGEPLFIPDIAKDPGITDIDRIIAKHQERRSFLHVPLKVKDRVLGTIGVDRYRTKMKISQREVEDLAIFANQAAIIIENARLYKELRDEKLLSDNIIRSSINGIIVSDLRGKIIHLNPQAEEILCIDKDEAVKLHIQDAFNGDIAIAYEELSKKRKYQHFEMNYQRRDGNKLILDVAIFPLQEAGESSSKVVLLIDDLTEKRRIDEHLIRVEKFAALGGMAAGIAHEIRNPMAAIFTTIQHVENNLDDTSPHKYALQNVTKELDRIECLIRELLNAMNPLSFHMEQVDIMDLLERALFFVKRKTGEMKANVKFELKGDRIYTKADPNRLMQVFLNIMINSVEAIKGRGKIKVDVKEIKEQESNNHYLTINFNDNGSGISSSIKAKIFDPFFTTKNSGTGLGLTVSHKIIQDHHGFIEVDSEKNRGTNVLIKLPIVK